MTATSITWGIAGLTALGIVVRPFRLPEATWAILGAFLLFMFGVLAGGDILAGVAKGVDVYLFLIGMMLLSELARLEGLFDWIAAVATTYAKGSPTRLFVSIYLVGTVVTVFLSNDATAVVLTPAVYAACRAAQVRSPLPYLFICAFIANAASFVLPISNPANLVVFAGGEMPALSRWLSIFAAPSLAAIIVTFLALYLSQRRVLAQETLARHVDRPPLKRSAKIAGFGLAITAVVLVAASAAGMDLGVPTFVAGVATSVLVLLLNRASPVPLLKGVSWSVLPLVAGLFVIVEALGKTGLTEVLASVLSTYALAVPEKTAALAGLVVAIVCNLVNNLPAGLFAGSAVAAAHVPDVVAGAVLVGVDLGPNLSVTGSLATILWLAALRREGIDIGALAFLRLGTLVMFPALAAALAALVLFAGG